MKKLFSLAAIALFMVSCSDDDTTSNQTNQPDNTLLKKTIYTDQTGATNTSFYTYDGNKIVSILDENGTGTLYTYTGNLITHIESVGDNSEQEITYEYNSNNQKVSGIERYKFSIGELTHEQWTKNIYSYNEDGSVTVTTHIGEQEDEWTFTTTDIISYTENSITYLSATTTFDNKNDPMKNVVGYNEYKMPQSFLRNSLTMSIEGIGNATYTYTYNENNYPLTLSTLVQYEGQSPITSTTQYFY